MDHYANPRNVGEIEDANRVGEVGNAKCGDIMKMYLKIEDNTIKDVKFKTCLLYTSDENFIIDEEAAPVVKQIYRLCLAGNGPTKIARMPVSYTHLNSPGPNAHVR